MEAIILAGGLGTRLSGVVSDLPKPLAPVNGRPFLNYTFRYLLRNQIAKAILATGHLHHKIEEAYGKRYKGLDLDYSVERQPLGTGGCIRRAFDRVSSDDILIINGDTFFNVQVDGMLTQHETTNAVLTIALKPMQNISRYGIVRTESTRVISFEEKKKVDAGQINGGVYLARRQLFDGFELPKRFSFEEDFLKKFTSRLMMHAYVSDAYFIDIGVPEDYQRAQSEMREYE